MVLVNNVQCILSYSYQMPAGFTHSAFTLGYEAGINKCTIDGNLIPPGALITVVQKGLQYLEMEANLSNVSMLIFINLLGSWVIPKNIRSS